MIDKRKTVVNTISSLIIVIAAGLMSKHIFNIEPSFLELVILYYVVSIKR